MRQFITFFVVTLLLWSLLPQSIHANSPRIRKNIPAIHTTHQYIAPTTIVYNWSYYDGDTITTQAYRYSPTYIQGYTYYSTPRPGYYFYPNIETQNRIYVNPGHAISNQYYTSQNYAPGSATITVYSNWQYYYPHQYGYTSTRSAYPGCNKSNIIIGGQEWSACNSIDRNRSSSEQSGWFFAGDIQSTFLSYNGIWNSLAWQGKQTRNSSWTQWACATGYRIPSRSEWEMAIFYARQNGTTLATLLWLPYNGAFYGYRDSDGNVTLSKRADVNGAYWTSSIEWSNPTILHLASSYAWYRTDGTDYTNSHSSTRWQYTEKWLVLTQSNYSEIANVRCIKN